MFGRVARKERQGGKGNGCQTRIGYRGKIAERERERERERDREKKKGTLGKYSINGKDSENHKNSASMLS